MTTHPVIDELIRLVESDPLPEADVSSHWRAFGAQTVVERAGPRLLLRASGFQTVHRLGPVGKVLSRIERLSYLRVTRRLNSYGSVWRQAVALAKALGADPDYYVFRSACALAVILDHCAQNRLRLRTIMLIGDGEGFFGALLRRAIPGTTVFSVDLPKQLVFQARTYAGAEPLARMSLGPGSDGEVRFTLPGEIEAIPHDVDLAVSIASMQEMTPRSIEAYFRCLRRRSSSASRFYCVSRAEKVLPGGEVSRFAAYPWSPADEVFTDGICPYYTHYLSRHTSPTGPRLLGVRIPFMNHFDGVHLHRLARLGATS